MQNARTLLVLAPAWCFCAPAAAQTGPDLVWRASPTTQSLYDQALAVLPDDVGGAWVLGTARMTPGHAKHSLSRFGPDGAELWTILFGSDTINRGAFGLCSDGAGGVFACGELEGAGFAGTPFMWNDGYLARFDGAGNLLWDRRIGGNSWDFFGTMVPDGAGGVIVTGRTQSTDFGGPQVTVIDGFVARYDSNGTELWVTRVTTPTLSPRLFGVTVDAAGAVFCVGWVPRSGSSDRDAAAAHLDLQGNLIWYEPRLVSLQELIGVTPDGAGGFVAVGLDDTYGEGRIVRVDGAGHVIWQRLIEPSGAQLPFTAGSSVTRTVGGDFIVGGWGASLGGMIHGWAAYMKCFSAQGVATWLEVVEPSPTVNGEIASIHSDGKGSVFVAGLRDWVGNAGGRSWVARYAVDRLGRAGCTGQPNSTGLAARTQAVGSDVRADDAVTLFTDRLPPNSFGYYVASATSGFAASAGGSQGDLCLAGGVSRLNLAGQILDSGAEGRFHLLLDLDQIPTPTGTTSVLAGQPWFFQGWYRDANPAATSNFSGSIEVVTN